MGKEYGRVELADFLAKAKGLMVAGEYDFVPRRRNLQALAAIGFTVADAKEEIMGLKEEDYYKGSKQDFDPQRPGEIWEFKKNIDGKPFYVKLKIQLRNGKEVLKCLSFHEDDYV